MTKPRPPLTFSRALARIADLIGWDGCAQVVGKSESLLRKLGDPDTEREISMQASRRLDGAYQRAGGEGAPMLECYMLQLNVQPGSSSSAGDLLSAARTAAQHNGDAVCASLATIENDANDSVRSYALGRCEDAIRSMTRLAAKLGGTGDDTR